MIELLSPAGDIEKLKFALMYGADAVYIGGQDYSLRANAKNFTREEIKEYIESHGGYTSDSVSKKTDVVLVGEAAGSKKEKAEQLKITIWNQEKLFEIMGIVEK